MNLTSVKPTTADTFWEKVQARTRANLESGLLQPVHTRQITVEHDGIHYLFHILVGRNRKVETLVTQKKEEHKGRQFNPFLPYEKEMEITRLTPTHVCLLNKFPVIDGHLLIITEHFEHQDTALTHADFQAMWALQEQADGLVFYNGGARAGASQRHKHLQWIPLPLSKNRRTPIAPLLTVRPGEKRLHTLPSLPFSHVFALFDQKLERVGQTHALYNAMLRSLALSNGHDNPGAYNLLATPNWMLMVPRSAEFTHGISFNAMAYVGSIFVRNEEQFEQVKRIGPMNLLRNVAFPR